ncbi:hypothetical protein LCGC14_2769310, partial [marine sediment metagenome]
RRPPTQSRSDVTVPNTELLYNADVLQRLVCSYSWPCEEALRVIECESKGDPNAYSPAYGGMYGLMQIHYGSHYDKFDGVAADLFDPVVNLEVGNVIWQDSGWEQWECKP